MTEQSAAALEGGSYEVLRERLGDQAKALGAGVDALDARRRETFGATSLDVISNERVRTKNNCVPRDIVSVADHMLLGFNVFMGLKKETTPADVFSLHRFTAHDDGESFDLSAVGADAAGGFLADPMFLKQFGDLYKYYRDARLLQLRRTDTRLLAVFQIGTAVDDIKVMRWRIAANGGLQYTDDRGDVDHVFADSHDFEWKTATREQQVSGVHPHINIDDEVFVETVGGDLTVKIEDNTESGEGIYAEPVDEANQTLDDAEFQYARVGGLILLRILPYREQAWRHLVFNTRTKAVVRIDAIGQSCVELPEDHGIMFPGGYYLQTGGYKVFDIDSTGLEFKRRIKSPNGEDVLFVYHRRADGHYLLLPYNLIRKEVSAPIGCHGYSLFTDGRMVIFRTLSDEPTRVHPMQVWQTPFTSAEFAASAPTDGSFIAKVGNAELVRGISDAYSIQRLAGHDDPNRQTFEDLIAAARRMTDAYYWLGREEAGDLAAAIEPMIATAELIIDEYEKVLAFRRKAANALSEAVSDQVDLVARTSPEDFADIDAFMEALGALRQQRGRLIGLRELRYIDTDRVRALEDEVVEAFETVSRTCVEFLLRDDALEPLTDELDALLAHVADTRKIQTTNDIRPLVERADAIGKGLDVVSEVVAGLEVDDATQRTVILERISGVYSVLNRARASISQRDRALKTAEGRAEFGAQFALLGQSAQSAIAVCDTPEKCDEQLSRLMILLEELEGRFGEFEEFTGDLASKREEIYDAFGSKKQTLLDARQRRAQSLIGAADRIITGVARRAGAFDEDDALNAYFAADPMVAKLRQIVQQLRELGDAVKADELESRLKSAKQDALRGMRDKVDLFETGEGGPLIKLGRHRFSVNTQPFELSVVPRREGMALHLNGTEFYQPLDDPEFEATQPFWSQTLVSETDEVYRAEYLATSVLFAAEAGCGELTPAGLEAARIEEGGLASIVREVAQSRYDEGYERGVHDADATRILDALLALYASAGLLRFGPAPRALAWLYWSDLAGPQRNDARAHRRRKAVNLGRLRAAFGPTPALTEFAAELGEEISAFVDDRSLAGFTPGDAELAGRYLVEELMGSPLRFTASGDAAALGDDLWQYLDEHGGRGALADDLRALEGDVVERFEVARAWLDSFAARPEAVTRLGGDPRRYVVEAAVLLADDGLDRDVSQAMTRAEVGSLLGQHPRIRDGKLVLEIDELLTRLTRFVGERVPGFRAYREQRGALIERWRDRLRLDEYRPKVMSAFVRNKLINDVYLPMIGDNLAKQMGAAGAAKRTDLMGLLLLISPPGYGKTTLMEYTANRLGLVFVKINGPALGHAVTSLDPAEAANATAKQEVEKINFALEMGNNVMLYLDDIQHTHPELLQKFISLCDAQRRIEGIWQGRTRTYDLRGRKFCVVMAGNPYTESGEKFQIPDMLSNRADTYNLGDILSGKEDAFAMSYIENALTSNPVTAPLATRDRDDIYKILRMAAGEEVPTTDLKHDYSGVELEELKAVFARLFRCRDVLLKVNALYIESASMDDAFRIEPSFKLQGSYRNMTKLAEKVASAMNDDELERLIGDHYTGEAQTLTTGAEQNLLKLAELRGRPTPEQIARWTEIKREFMRRKHMGGGDDDPVARVTGTLSGLGTTLESIHDALDRGSTTALGTSINARLDALRATIEWAADREHPAPVDLVPHVERIVAALQTQTQPALDVTVHQTAPAGIEELLAQQVAIVERTLVPLVQTTTRHLEDGHTLNAELLRLIGRLKTLDQQMRTGLR